MAITLLTHAYGQGGSTSVTPTYAQATLDSNGADFLLVGCTGGAEHPNPVVDTFSDSEDNTWTKIVGFPSSGDGHSGNTCQSAYFWCINPKTSPTHHFTMTTITPSSLNGSVVASAWVGLDQTMPFDVQTWGTSLSPSVSIVGGLAVSALIIGYGDGNSGSNVGTASAGWTLIEQAPSVTDALNPFVGCNFAYKLISGPATASVTWTVPGTVVSGTGAGIFAFLAASAPPPPPAATTYSIRRLRRFMLPWDDANRQKFTSRLEFVMQTGIGLSTGQGSDPIVMIRFSKDGGWTWGNEIQCSAGAIGEYSARVFANRFPVCRNPVVEMTVSDAVNWQFVQALADMDTGLS